ncbi:MAG TPA: calcium-binding protein [Solirubrobacteraceae bacterium]|jgi:Ca2+-binding RTX toxin-like protein
MRARLALPALVALALFAFPSLASAGGTLTRSGGAYTYVGTSGVDALNITASPGSMSVNDSSTITMAADASCNEESQGTNGPTITCTVTPTSISFNMDAGADTAAVQVNGLPSTIPLDGLSGIGDDNVTITASFLSGAATTATLNDSFGNDTLALNVTSISGVTQFGYGTVNGNTGDDTVSGTATVNGGNGNDILRGIQPGSGSVALNGGPEDDIFTPSDNIPERMNGGGGLDTVDYRASGQVSVSLNDTADDGPVGGTNDNANDDLSVEVVRTGQGDDTITGGGGNEQFFTGDGEDLINAGAGDDFIDGQGGADTVSGGSNGAGGDTVTYESRAASVRVTPDGIAANDGEANELDNLAGDVENIFGGFNSDSITGNASANTLNGGPGDDTLEGLGGNDTLFGGFGQDVLDGGANNDTLTGNAGDDTLDGGADGDTLNGTGGADLLDGSGGVDTLNGGDGPDTLLSRDGGADTVNCGAATDHSVHDVAGDTVNADCEISDTGAAGFRELDGPRVVGLAPTATPAVAGEAVAPALVTCVVSRAKGGGAKVRCRISGAAGAVTAKLVRGKRTFAKARRTGSGRLTLRAPKRARAGRYAVVLTQGGRAVARLAVRLR